MSTHERLRRQQLLREAEGYLELILAGPEHWPLNPAVRDRLAHRALDVLEEAEQLGARQAHVLFLRGQALRAMHRWREAIEPLQQAARLEADNIHIWLSLGWCYKRISRLDLAIQALEEALAVDSSEAIIFYNLACYWSLAQNAKLAIAYLARALDIDSNYRDQIGAEPDFDPIRNHPDFQAISGVIV